MAEQFDAVYSPEVEAAFKRVEVLSVSATAEAKAYFLDRALQLQDLAHLHANRPLARPGRPGWRFVAPPHIAAHLAQKAAYDRKRLENL